jgi:Transaldolase/Fructose-6-phosphate aldolase
MQLKRVHISWHQGLVSLPRVGALVERGRNIMQLFEELDVPRDKYLLRIPATWEGIQAAKTLEAEGAATHIIMVYRCRDGAVCWWLHWKLGKAALIQTAVLPEQEQVDHCHTSARMVHGGPKGWG